MGTGAGAAELQGEVRGRKSGGGEVPGQHQLLLEEEAGGVPQELREGE